MLYPPIWSEFRQLVSHTQYHARQKNIPEKSFTGKTMKLESDICDMRKSY